MRSFWSSVAFLFVLMMAFDALRIAFTGTTWIGKPEMSGAWFLTLGLMNLGLSVAIEGGVRLAMKLFKVVFQ